MGMSWTDRVEAVKSYVFDVEGNVAASIESKQAPGCYTLKDAIKLTCSADPTQQEAALLLIAAVLFKATEGLQAQHSSTEGLSENDTDVDWQAVWACAVGPGLELASSLRLALNDSNSPVITACAKALHALLSCSANEAIFGLQESLWPGNKSTFTAPVFRRATELQEGFIGVGRWKYHVRASGLYPEIQTGISLSDTEEEKDAVGDDATVLSKDVAAYLLQMDILTRIQYIFEVEQVQSANEYLLSVVIALSRHSPAAAKAVMKCPRLLDLIIQRFLLTDDDLNDGLRPAHTKAIQLLKILSQASAANCIRFAETGALQVAQCELYNQGFPLPSDPRIGEDSFKGVSATVVECLRLWRVCVNHQIGIALFSDIYPALCYWLAPLSCKEISSSNSEDMLFLAQESYNLLERLAWTLPVLHTQGSLHANWTWNVALPLVETASGWLSKDRIAAVNKELTTLGSIAKLESQNPERIFRMKLVATMASVFHFLATVCEMFTESGSEGQTNGSKKSLHPAVHQLAVALASNGLLTFRAGKRSTADAPSSMLETMLGLWGKVDEETAMGIISCIHGLVRLLSVTDKLYQSSEDTNGLLAKGGKELEILSRGLVSSVDGELRELLTLFGNEVMGSKVMASEGAEIISGPAPGLGIGWGQVGGGVWSKRGLLLNRVARLVTELLEILPFRNGIKNTTDKNSRIAELMWRISCCLRVGSVFGPGDGDMVYRIYSNVMLHSEIVTLVLQGVDAPLTVGGGAVQNGSTHVNEDISKVLLEHYKKTWICTEPDKPPSDDRQGNRKRLKSSLIAAKLSNLSEESARLAEANVGKEGLRKDLVAEWAKQRLPLPSYCVFSPMAINLTGLIDGGNSPECEILDDGKFIISEGKQIAMEDSIECGVTWLLGLEVLSQSLSNSDKGVLASIPLVRKVHSLSGLFLLGGDMFLRKSLKDRISSLQQLYGRLLDAGGPNPPHGIKPKVLDFEGEIDEGYSAFVEALVKKFSNASSTDAGFAGQVALYLRQDVASSIRLQAWRALASAQSLDLLPPLSECIGDPSGYLSPSETNLEMIEAFVSAWTSGNLALNTTGGKISVASSLALHSTAAFLFEEKPATDETLLRKAVKTLFDLSYQIPQYKDLLQKLVERSLSWPAEPLSSGELERRLNFLQAASGGDDVIMNQLKRLRGVVFQSTHS